MGDEPVMFDVNGQRVVFQSTNELQSAFKHKWWGGLTLGIIVGYLLGVAMTVLIWAAAAGVFG